MSITNPVFSSRLKTLATLGAALFVSAGVAAQTVVDQTAAAQTAEAQAWRTQLTPYVWMTGLQGHIQPVSGAPTVQVDKSFSEVLENLDAAFFVSGTARKDRWVLHGDFSHASTSSAEPLPMGLSARAKVRQSSLTLTGGRNWQLTPQSSVDLLGGVRVWDIHAQVQVPGVASAQSNTSFVDPVVAVRWRYDFDKQWSSLLYADAGGFGVGSDVTWQALASINYQWRENIYLSLGYRHLSVDYRSGGKRLDFSQTGPLLGVTFKY